MAEKQLDLNRGDFTVACELLTRIMGGYQVSNEVVFNVLEGFEHGNQILATLLAVPAIQSMFASNVKTIKLTGNRLHG